MCQLDFLGGGAQHGYVGVPWCQNRLWTVLPSIFFFRRGFGAPRFVAARCGFLVFSGALWHLGMLGGRMSPWPRARGAIAFLGRWRAKMHASLFYGPIRSTRSFSVSPGVNGAGGCMLTCRLSCWQATMHPSSCCGLGYYRFVPAAKTTGGPFHGLLFDSRGGFGASGFVAARCGFLGTVDGRLSSSAPPCVLTYFLGTGVQRYTLGRFTATRAWHGYLRCPPVPPAPEDCSTVYILVFPGISGLLDWAWRFAVFRKCSVYPLLPAW